MVKANGCLSNGWLNELIKWNKKAHVRHSFAFIYILYKYIIFVHNNYNLKLQKRHLPELYCGVFSNIYSVIMYF